MSRSSYYALLGPKPFQNEDYSIASVRFSDGEPIRKWRNEQISALRQARLLSQTEQTEYFTRIIEDDFNQMKPSQILMRFCLNDYLIGYGGIVHLDWANLRGEVSFLLDTARTKDSALYSRELVIFFGLIKELGFKKLGLHKLTTEAYAHRANHIDSIEDAGFKRDGILRDHVKINGRWVDAVVASCLCEEFINGQS